MIGRIGNVVTLVTFVVAQCVYIFLGMITEWVHFFLLLQNRLIFCLFHRIGGEVSHSVTSKGAHPYEPIHSHKGLPEVNPCLLSNSSTHNKASYLHPQILHPNHIKNP